MQNVVCPTTMVHSDKWYPLNEKNDFNAMPVTMPGKAIGKRSRNETTSRPKNRNRCTAKAASDPSANAAVVARTPALIESTSASRTSGSCQATVNQLSEKCWIGQL